MIQLDSIVELEALLPSQYSDRRRRRTPEHRLMMAIVHDALDCIRRHRFARDRSRRRLFDDATHWLVAHEPDWPYSFERICAALDLDSNAVREHLGVAPTTEPLVSDSAGRFVPFGGRIEEPCEQKRRVPRPAGRHHRPSGGAAVRAAIAG